MHLSKSFHIGAFAVVCLSLAGCATVGRDRQGYVVEEQGRATVRALFDKRMPSSADQWNYARATQHEGHLRTAGQRMLYLVRRWPNSKEAPWAARARADMFFARGKSVDAFKAYQFLIDNYSSRMQDYDGVLQNQFDIAVKLMNRRRMRWLFGGYRAPEYAVDYFETVIRNGPQSPIAAEAQMLIGQSHQEAGDLEMAISAYEVLGYRYAESRFAEEGAWQQIICLDELRREFPNSMEMLERLLTASTVFLSTYPDSKHGNAVIGLRNELYEIRAGELMAKAAFYETVARNAAAAVICYETLIEDYSKSRRRPEAEARLRELRILMATPKGAGEPAPIRSRQLPFTKGG